MGITVRTITTAIGALLLGLTAAWAVTTADARPSGQAGTAAAATRAGSPATGKRAARRVYRVRVVRGRGHVPKALLGSRWARIGAGAPTTTPAFTVPPTTTTTPASTVTTPTTTTPGLRALGVVADDDVPEGDPWRLQPSRETMPAGDYYVQLQNRGLAAEGHNLVVQRISTGSTIATFPTIQGLRDGKPTTYAEVVAFTQPGAYLLFCSVSDHYARGMHKQVTVTD